MYCLTVTYPKSETSHFDYDYYLEKHIPLCAEAFAGNGFLGTVLRTNQGSGPGSADLNYASIDLLFESAENLGAALQAGGQVVTADVANYTDARPTMVFSDIDLSVS